MRAGWRKELGAGDQRDLISGLHLPGPKEVVRSRFKPRSAFSASVGNPGRERGAQGGKEGSKLGTLGLYRLPGWGLRLCVTLPKARQCAVPLARHPMLEEFTVLFGR